MITASMASEFQNTLTYAVKGLEKAQLLPRVVHCRLFPNGGEEQEKEHKELITLLDEHSRAIREAIEKLERCIEAQTQRPAPGCMALGYVGRN